MTPCHTPLSRLSFAAPPFAAGFILPSMSVTTVIDKAGNNEMNVAIGQVRAIST